MARDRDWVDYTNLAANVVQTAQLDGINSKMRQMAELELLKEYREQQEAAVAKCEDLLRDAVFFYTEQLRDVEEIASQNPVAAYIRASHLKGTYENMPQFKASGFRKFEDKERLANVQRNFDRLIREGAARLKPDELKKCDLCITHIFERDDLIKLILAQEEREKVANDSESFPALKNAKEAILKRAERYQQKTIPAWFRIVDKLPWISLTFGFVGALSLILTVVMYPTGETPTILVLLTCSFLLCPTGFIAWFVLSRTNSGRNKAELEEHIAKTKAEIKTMTHELARREWALMNCEPFYAKFGKACSGTYRKMLLERDTLLAQMLGDFAKGFIERAQPQKACSCDVVLVAVPAEKKIAIINAIRDVLPGLSLAEAKSTAEILPALLLSGVSKAQADTAGDALVNAGARVEITAGI